MIAQCSSFKGTLISTMTAIMGLLTINPVSAQDWHDTEWQYRREVTIVNPSGTELTDFQVQITLYASFEFANANSDGSDIRITDTDGTTLIPFWIESWDEIGQHANIWVKIPSVPTGGATVYLYYGNTAAINVSNGDNTFEFFDDFESSVTTQPGYYAFGPASTIMVHTQGWEYTAPHTLSVVEAPAGAAYTYYGYYGMQGCNGIGMAGSDDLLNWTKFPEFPSPEPNNPLFAGDGERWASVFLDGSLYYMVHTTDDCMTSNIVYRESTDGVNWTTATIIVPPASDERNQNPNLFHNPNNNQYYLYWFKKKAGIQKIMARTATTVAGLISASDIELLSSSDTIAAPNMLFYDGTYFLSTAILESVWKVRIYSGTSPLGPFTILPGNPVLDDGCGCLFQTLFSDMIYEYYCKETSGTWTLDLRVVDPSTGRIMYELGEIDPAKWTPDGGNWSVKSDLQQDGTEGFVTEGNTATKSILKSSFTGSDYILEGYGRQIADHVWGFGIRTIDAQNTYALNIYEDLDLTDNLYIYRFHTVYGNNNIWNTDLGVIDPNIWYKLTVKAYGNNFDIYVDDVLKTTTPAFDDSWSSGSIALYGEDGTIAQFNDIRVRKYADSEPSTIVGDEQNQSTLIDIAVYNTTCGDFEVSLRPNPDIDNNYFTNIQFTIKWPANTVNLTDFSSTFGVALQGSVAVENDTNYAILVSTVNTPISWTAGNEYTILSFSHDFTGTGYANFEIDEGSWSAANNGMYYTELLGLDYTGSVYGNATNVYLGRCGEFNVLLQGPYGGSGIMNKGLIGIIPLTQPYNVSPWNYSGPETISVVDGSVIDWVLVELRSDEYTIEERKAALLLEDGQIVQYDNIGHGVHFENTTDGSSFYIVVHHRNHMPVMTAVSTVFDGTLVDFSDETICYGTPNAEIELETGIYGMIAGDINSNGYLSYSGPGNDRGLILARIVSELGTTNINDTAVGYFDEDVMMDYQVKYIGSNNDRAVILTNLGTLTGTSYLNAVYQTPVPLTSKKSKPASNGPIHIYLTETTNEFQVKITTDQDILNGIVDNVQFTLSWDINSNGSVAPVLEQIQSDFGLLPQGEAKEYDGNMYLTYVSVLPVELPDQFFKDEQMVLISFIKNQEIELSNTIRIADNDNTAIQNGSYYISLLGTDHTGTIHTSALGIQNLQDQVVSIYPNPVTSGILNVEIQLAKSQQIILKVLDIHGKIVATHSLVGYVGNVAKKINLKHCSKGIYYIKVETNDNNSTIRKVIIL